MSDITIRRATSADAAPIAEIYNHYVVNSLATFDTMPKSTEDREWWLSDRDPRHPVLVAERDDEVIGWAALGPYRERPAWGHTSEVAVYVAESQRGGGVGRRLLSALVDEARCLGLHALVSQVVAGNDASVCIAERAGFERVGVLREVGRKFGVWVDVVIMELVLPRPRREAER